MLKLIASTLPIILLAFACLQVLGQEQHSQHHPPQTIQEYIKALEDSERNEWQKPDLVVDTLALKPGDEVADLGAGSGYFTIRLARAVGPSGKVYAVDVDQRMLDYIDQRAQKEKLDNIQTVLAAPNDPHLGSASVDLILICDTLHHIGDRDKYYPRLARALRPGGHLVNIDFQKRDMPLGPPLEMKIAKKDCAKEFRDAGFSLLHEFDFLKYQYFLIFEYAE